MSMRWIDFSFRYQTTHRDEFERKGIWGQKRVVIKIELLVCRNRIRYLRNTAHWAYWWHFTNRNVQNEVRVCARANVRTGLLRKRLLRRYRHQSPVSSFPPVVGPSPQWRNTEFCFLVQSARYAKKVAMFILLSRRIEATPRIHVIALTFSEGGRRSQSRVFRIFSLNYIFSYI